MASGDLVAIGKRQNSDMVRQMGEHLCDVLRDASENAAGMSVLTSALSKACRSTDSSEECSRWLDAITEEVAEAMSRRRAAVTTELPAPNPSRPPYRTLRSKRHCVLHHTTTKVRPVAGAAGADWATSAVPTSGDVRARRTA